MAADVYLQIDGVNGESNDDKHRGWIEVEAVDWGVTQPIVGTMSTAGKMPRFAGWLLSSAQLTEYR